MLRSARMPLILITTLVLVVAGIIAVRVSKEAKKQASSKSDEHHGPTLFREMAHDAGIDFRMSFLPAEQGLYFKINLYDHGCGVAVADFDGDGFDDIYLLNQLGKNGLFQNKGDGTFQDVTDKAGVGMGDCICVAAAWGDYDNSGHPSLFVTTTRGGNQLFRNMGGGKFEKVDMTKAGLALDKPRHAQTAVFFDYDNDGYLDLFVTNTAEWTLNDYDDKSHYYVGPKELWDLAAAPKESNTLFHNNGDGTFTDVTKKAQVQGKGWGGDVAVFDYDGDGFLDLFVTNMFGASQLYHNNGDGTFSDVTKELLGRTSFGAIGAKAFDSRNIGHFDLFVTDMHSDMWLPPEVDPRSRPAGELQKKYLAFTGPTKEGEATALREDRARAAFDIEYDAVVFGNTFYNRQHDGKFKEVSDQAHVETFWPWGSATGDFDNDGFEDIFIPSGMGYPFKYWPNSLMMNQGDGTFQDRAHQTGLEPPPGGTDLDTKIGVHAAARSSRSAAIADFRNEGRLDIIVNNFNDAPYYFQNDFPKRNWIGFRLTGAMRPGDPPDRGHFSNRDAIGALVKIHVGKEVMLRQVHGAGGYLSQSSLALHFGLGDRSKVDSVEILWPSGKRQTIDGPEINRQHKISEPRE